MSIAEFQSDVIRGMNAGMREAVDAMKQATTEILFLRASDEIKTRALKAAREKLNAYRIGTWDPALMALIEEAIGP